MPTNRDIVVMVDGTYFRKTVHEVLGHGVDPDYAALLKWLDHTGVAEARYYDSMPYQDPAEPASEITRRRAAEFADVAKSGFVIRQGVCVRKGPPQYRMPKGYSEVLYGGPAQYEQHEIDTLMVADLVAFAMSGTKHFIVITGNQDVAPGIEVAVDRGAKVDILADRHYSGVRLIETASTVHRLQVSELKRLVKPARMEVAA